MTQKARSRVKKPGARGSRWSRLLPLAGPGIIMVAAIVAMWPQVVTGPSCNGDFYFHFVSWTDAQRSMLQGILYPHWANSPNFGYGEPRFVFYPPLSWMAGALLGLVLPWRATPLAFTFLLMAGTGLANRAFARELMDDAPATLAGCAAMFLGRDISDISLRCDFAELTGGFWLPLLLMFLLRDRNPSGTVWKRAFDGSAAPLALVMAGIWLSNGPLGIEANYLAFAVAILCAALLASWAPLLRATTGVALGMALDAFYLVPAVWERKAANFQEAVTRLDFRVENSWLFQHHADTVWWPHDRLLQKVSVIATLMFAVTVVSLFVAWKRGTLPKERRPAIVLAVIPFVVFFLLLPVSLPIWNWLPEMRFLQFPWRWLLVMQTSLAVFFASAVWVVPMRRRIASLAACAVAFFVVSTVAWSFCVGDCKLFNTALENWAEQGGAYGKPEYAPPGVPYLLVLPDVPGNCVIGNLNDLASISGAPGEVMHEAQAGSEDICRGKVDQVLNLPELKAFKGVVDQAGYLVLRLRSFPAWQVNVNGRPAATAMEPGHGLVAVPVTPGPVDVIVKWRTTPDVVAGRWMSALALALMVALYFGERRLRPE